MPALVAVSVTGVLEETGLVEMVTVAEDAPAGIVTVVGMVAAALLEARLIVSPLAGATPSSVTVPVAVVPAGTALGATVKPLN